MGSIGEVISGLRTACIFKQVKRMFERLELPVHFYGLRTKARGLAGGDGYRRSPIRCTIVRFRTIRQRRILTLDTIRDSCEFDFASKASQSLSSRQSTFQAMVRLV